MVFDPTGYNIFESSTNRIQFFVFTFKPNEWLYKKINQII